MSFCGDDVYWQSSARNVVKKIATKTNRAKFDMIVCQGLSGQSIGFLAAYEMGVPLLVLRKTTGEEHSKRAASRQHVALLEGANLVRQWAHAHGKPPRVLFVDDCIASGNTRARCGAAVHAAGGVLTCEATGDGFHTLTTSCVESFKNASMTARRAAQPWG